MNPYRRVLLGMCFLLAGVLMLGLVACKQSPAASQQSKSTQSKAAPAESGAASTGKTSGGGTDLAQVLRELEGVKAEDVPLSTGTIEVELKDFEFVPNVFHVKAGDVTFVFNNTSTHAHNFRITAWDDHENVIYPGPKIGARRQRKVTITLEPGVYYVFCNLSDHEERGMVGKLFVAP